MTSPFPLLLLLLPLFTTLDLPSAPLNYLICSFLNPLPPHPSVHPIRLFPFNARPSSLSIRPLITSMVLQGPQKQPPEG